MSNQDEIVVKNPEVTPEEATNVAEAPLNEADVGMSNLEAMKSMSPIDQMVHSTKCFATALMSMLPNNHGVVVEVPVEDQAPNSIGGKFAILHIDGVLHIDPTIDQSYEHGSGIALADPAANDASNETEPQ